LILFIFSTLILSDSLYFVIIYVFIDFSDISILGNV